MARGVKLTKVKAFGSLPSGQGLGGIVMWCSGGRCYPRQHVTNLRRTKRGWVGTISKRGKLIKRKGKYYYKTASKKTRKKKKTTKRKRVARSTATRRLKSASAYCMKKPGVKPFTKSWGKCIRTYYKTQGWSKGAKRKTTKKRRKVKAKAKRKGTKKRKTTAKKKGVKRASGWVRGKSGGAYKVKGKGKRKSRRKLYPTKAAALAAGRKKGKKKPARRKTKAKAKRKAPRKRKAKKATKRVAKGARGKCSNKGLSQYGLKICMGRVKRGEAIKLSELKMRYPSKKALPKVKKSRSRTRRKAAKSAYEQAIKRAAGISNGKGKKRKKGKKLKIGRRPTARQQAAARKRRTMAAQPFTTGRQVAGLGGTRRRRKRKKARRRRR